jgi:cytochrome c553
MKILLIIFIALINVQSYADETSQQRIVHLPPASLAQWYKPQNKRQIWLHTMFRLRREMQAISEYVEIKDKTLLAKWINKFAKDYRAIGKMVPEWNDELELEKLEQLIGLINTNNFVEIKSYLHKLKNSCNSCHNERRAIVASLMRTPNYDDIKIKGQTYDNLMQELSLYLNRIKIATEDKRKNIAIQAVHDLKNKLNDLKTNCNSCHDRDNLAEKRILGKETNTSLDKLLNNIEQNKPSGRLLGEFAVNVCARCHGIHRNASDLVQFIRK